MKQKPKSAPDGKAKTARPRKPRGGGGDGATGPASSKMVLDAEKKTQSEWAEASAKNAATVGTISQKGKKLALLSADSPEAFESAKEIVEAGIWLLEQAEAWGLPAASYWELHTFPNHGEDWRAAMKRLQESTLDTETQFFGGMHSIEWTMKHLWEWLHNLAESARNPNFKQAAGSLLGSLYREARKESKRTEELRESNPDFERALVPFTSKREPDEWLVRWINSKLWLERDFWRRAIEVAVLYERLKNERRLKVGKTLKDVWAWWLEDQKQRPGAAWNDYLQELEAHPFCWQMMTLDELSTFSACWEKVLARTLKRAWLSDDSLPTDDSGKRPSFMHRFGDSKFPAAGYRIVEANWTRFCFDLRARNLQQERIHLELGSTETKAKRRKSRAG